MKSKPAARKLKTNENTRVPEYFIFTDTETTQHLENERLYHRLRLGVAIFWRNRKDGWKEKKEVFRYTSETAFWEWATDKVKGRNTLYLVTHNTTFDMTVLKFRTILTDLGWKCTFVFELGHTFICKWVKGNTRIVILDNANWFRGKLEKWGKTLGVGKLEMPSETDSLEKWYEYCERDVEILYLLQKWLIEFIQSNDLGNWKITLPSIAFNAYRHRFMTHPIYIPEETRETYLSRQAYRGGRTECFKTGGFENGPFYKLDINSMYPYVMARNMYPCAVEGYSRNTSLQTITKRLGKNSFVGKFRLCVNLPVYPFSFNGKTVYPIGTFTTYLTTPEIKMAIENGWVIDVIEIAMYRQREVFTSFVDFFYGERLRAKENGNLLLSTLFKLVLNSLYGKFGQRGYSDKVIGSAPLGTWETSYHLNKVTGTHAIIRQVGTNIIKSEKSGEGYNAFVAIAAHVTAYARLYLYDLVLRAGRENTYYTDTDSLIVNQAGYNNLKDLLDDTQLGKLKCEGVSDRIAIKAPKHYYFNGNWTIKGVRKNAEKTGENTYRQEIWPGFNKILVENREEYYNYFISKELRAKVESGIIHSDGSVTPYVMRE